MGNRLKLYFIILGLLISAASTAHAAYTFTEINFPGSSFTSAQGINDSGNIVGYHTDSTNKTHGFLYAGGSFSPIDVPGALATFAQGINDSGNIVGYYTDSTNRAHGFLYAEGSFGTINFPGAFGTYAYGINDSDHIVGSYTDFAGFHFGFLYAGGSFTMIDFSSSGAIVYNTWANGIDSLGNIVGYYTDATGYHGFLYSGGSFRAIHFPGATKTIVNGINNAGDFLGYCFSSGSDHGFLAISEGAPYIITPIDYPGASVTYPYGINNARNILGNYEDAASSRTRGFLDVGRGFTPIDYPGASATYAHEINDSGNIVGYYIDATGTQGHHGFLGGGGNFIPIDYPGASGTYAQGINNSGNIVGYYIDATGTQGHHGFLNSRQSFTLIDYPGSFGTEAHGISNSGNIVGTYVTAGGTVHGFLYAAGTFTPIDVLGASGTYTTGINDSGNIVGYYASEASIHGFLGIRRAASFNSISVAPASVDFGNVTVAQSLDQMITIANQVDSAAALTGNVGPVSGPFSVVSGGGPFVLNPGQSTAVTVRFSPTTEGTASGNLSITHNATNRPSPLAVELSGAGVLPGIHVLIGPISANFGNITVGQSSDQTITITNQSDSSGNLSGNVGALFAPFSVERGGGAFNLTPGQSVLVKVQFLPTTAGPASANLSITHNATNRTSPSNISLSGTGISTNVPRISVTPTANDYGNVKVKRSKTASFVAKNRGKANLSITSAITGTDASMFSITSGNGNKTIKPGKTLTIKVAFKPTSKGSKSSTLEITSNDPAAPTVDIPLNGTGQ